jgi:hypothetical protein
MKKQLFKVIHDHFYLFRRDPVLKAHYFLIFTLYFHLGRLGINNYNVMKFPNFGILAS